MVMTTDSKKTNDPQITVIGTVRDSDDGIHEEIVYTLPLGLTDVAVCATIPLEAEKTGQFVYHCGENRVECVGVIKQARTAVGRELLVSTLKLGEFFEAVSLVNLPQEGEDTVRVYVKHKVQQRDTHHTTRRHEDMAAQ